MPLWYFFSYYTVPFDFIYGKLTKFLFLCFKPILNLIAVFGQSYILQSFNLQCNSVIYPSATRGATGQGQCFPSSLRLAITAAATTAASPARIRANTRTPLFPASPRVGLIVFTEMRRGSSVLRAHYSSSSHVSSSVLQRFPRQ